MYWTICALNLVLLGLASWRKQWAAIPLFLWKALLDLSMIVSKLESILPGLSSIADLLRKGSLFWRLGEIC